MATVEQQSADISRNGSGNGRTFAVDNPATGATIAHLPDMDAVDAIEAQPTGAGDRPVEDALIERVELDA